MLLMTAMLLLLLAALKAQASGQKIPQRRKAVANRGAWGH
jgi:hypothetical protein